MFKTRAWVALTAMILGLTIGLLGITPASAQRSISGPHSIRPQQVGGKFSLSWYPVLDIGRCLGINPQNNAVIFTCSYQNKQKWHRGQEKGTTGYYQLINDPGQCLGVAGGSMSRGAQVIGFSCNGADSQYWAIDFVNRTDYKTWVFNYNSNYVIEPESQSNGALVKQQPWNSNDQHNVWIYVSDSTAPNSRQQTNLRLPFRPHQSAAHISG